MSNRRIEKEVRRLAHHNNNIVKVTLLVFEERVLFKSQSTGWFSSIQVADGLETVLMEVHYDIPGELGNNSYISRNKDRSGERLFEAAWNDSIYRAERFAEQIEHIKLYK